MKVLDTHELPDDELVVLPGNSKGIPEGPVLRASMAIQEAQKHLCLYAKVKVGGFYMLGASIGVAIVKGHYTLKPRLSRIEDCLLNVIKFASEEGVHNVSIVDLDMGQGSRDKTIALVRKFFNTFHGFSVKYYILEEE